MKNTSDEVQWGQQRVVLLLAGYLLLFARRRIKKLLAKHVYPQGRPYSDDPLVLAARIYEHIRFIDTLIRQRNPASVRFFGDPAVHYRAAGATFAIGNFRRAAYLLNEVLGEKLLDNLPENEKGGGELNQMHFLRRLAEYHWLSFITEARDNLEDLEAAIEKAEGAYLSVEQPRDAFAREAEQRKIYCHQVTFAFWQYLVMRASARMDWEELLRFFVRTKERFHRHLGNRSKIENKGHALQALAIWEFAHGEHLTAKQTIAQALDLTLRKTPSHPLHQVICQRIFDFVHSVKSPRADPPT